MKNYIQKLANATTFKEARKYSIRWIKHQVESSFSNINNTELRPNESLTKRRKRLLKRVTPEHIELFECKHGIKVVGKGCSKRFDCKKCRQFHLKALKELRKQK